MKLNSPKIVAVIAGVALLWAGSVPSGMAQTYPPSVPSTSVKPPASAPGSTAGAVTVPPGSRVIEITPSQVDAQVTAAPARAPRHARIEGDARHCLALETDTAIIKCAEKYL